MNHIVQLLAIQTLVCALFLAGTYGIGELVRRIFAFQISSWFSCALGLMALLAFQGVSGLSLYFGRLAVYIVVLAGILLSVGFSFRFFRAVKTQELKSIFWDFFFLIIVTAGVVPLFLSSTAGFNQYADKVGYAVHVARFLDVGGYGPDPFNSRIIESGLGGFNYILSIVAGLGLPLYQLPVVERFLAPFVGLLCLLGFAKDFRFGLLGRLVLVSILITIVYIGIAFRESYTLTGTLTALPLCMLMFRLFALKTEEFTVKKTFLIGFLVAAICSLKTTHIVNLALLMPILFLASEGSIKNKVTRGALAATVSLLLLFPLMLNLYASSGTFLYPILGKGIHGSVYGIYYSPDVLSNLASPESQLDLLKTSFLFLPLLVFSVTYREKSASLHEYSARNASVIVLSIIGLFFAALLAVLLTGYYRYAYASFFMACCVFLIDLEQLPKFLLENKRHLFLGCLCILAMTVVGDLKKGLNQAKNTAMTGLFLDRGVTPEVVSLDTVRAAQQLVPAGQLILARMGQAYFFDFKRNPVWHIDIPGVASPPPGLPLSGQASGAELGSYFRNVGIKYLIYSEPDDGGHNVEFFLRKHLKGDAVKPWQRSISRNIVIFDELIEDLIANHSKVIFREDGIVLVEM